MAKQRKRRIRKEKTRPEKIKSFLVPKLRRISRMWPDKITARKLARRVVEIGKTKKGKPKFKVKYECNLCHNIFEKHDTQADHILPVVDPITGYVDIATYIDRLLAPPEGYQIICSSCHDNKTSKENIIRKQNGKDKRSN